MSGATRRLSRLALTWFPAIVRDYTDDEVMEINLVENVQREDLSAVEKAKLCAELRGRFPDKYQSWDGLARRIGVEAPTVRTWMRTLGLSEELQEKIAPRETQRVPEGKIDFRTALEIHQRIGAARQVEVAERLSQQPLSRAEREEVIGPGRWQRAVQRRGAPPAGGGRDRPGGHSRDSPDDDLQPPPLPGGAGGHQDAGDPSTA